MGPMVRLLALQCLPILSVLCSRNNSKTFHDEIDMCGKTDSYNSTDLPYSFANNAWGNDGSGFSCMKISENGSSFEARYQWTDNYFSVHGYPHIRLEDSRLPVNVSQLYSLDFKAQWSTYVDGTQRKDGHDQAVALDTARVQSNVAIDMFLDRTEDDATGFRPTYEIMIWFWHCEGVDPVGAASIDSNGNQMQYDIDDIRFYLSAGVNTHGQIVFSWVPASNLTSFNADVSPLIHYLWQFELMSPNLFLGLIEFGSENFYADTKTIFTAQNYNISFVKLNTSPNATAGDLTSLPPLQTPSASPTLGAAACLHSGSELWWKLGSVVLAMVLSFLMSS